MHWPYSVRLAVPMHDGGARQNLFFRITRAPPLLMDVNAADGMRVLNLFARTDSVVQLTRYRSAYTPRTVIPHVVLSCPLAMAEFRYLQCLVVCA